MELISSCIINCWMKNSYLLEFLLTGNLQSEDMKEIYDAEEFIKKIKEQFNHIGAPEKCVIFIEMVQLI